MSRNRSFSRRDEAGSDALSSQIRDIAQPLRNASDLDPLMARIGDARAVLLGEASHGTSDYYRWRSQLSQRLIQEKGFSFIAVEGDWPDCYRLNRYIKHRTGAGESAREVLHAFERWPTWMWANEEIIDLAEWLRHHNRHLPEDQKVGFFGLDVYSLWESLYQVLAYLQRIDPSAVPVARRAYQCFEPYGEDVQNYAHATALVSASCEPEVVALLTELRRHAPRYQALGSEAYFQAEQDALVAKNAEAYYRAMIRGGPASWNLRDRHMADTLDRLLRHHGPTARAIVWEHNTHIGDARFTDMEEDGLVNVGQLAREAYGSRDVVLVGFGSHRGSVIAGDEWEAPMRRMQVPPARPGSWEEILHQAGPHDKLLIFDERSQSEEMFHWRGHRAIGVVYHPSYEQYGNYVPTSLPRRYDAFLYLDETEALHPLHLPVHADHEVPETYPTGV